MVAVELLAQQARAAGLSLSLEGDQMMVVGPRSAAVPLLDTLRAYKPELVALLAREAAEVAWRVEVLVERISCEGPIWPVVVRPGNAQLDTPGSCSLCGEGLSIERLHSPWRRCAHCVAALHEALRTVREGVTTTAPFAQSVPASDPTRGHGAKPPSRRRE